MEREIRYSQSINELITMFELNRGIVPGVLLNESIFLELISYYKGEKNFDRAFEIINAAIEQHKYNTEFYLIKAKLLLSNKDYLTALATIERAEKIASNQLDIKLIKVKILSNVGEYDAAITMVNELASKVTKEELPIVYLTESYIYESMLDNEAMYNVLYKAAVLDPTNEEILLSLWSSIQTSRFYYKGIKLYKRLIDIQPFSYLAWYHLGNAYIYVGEYTKAIDAMEYSFLIKEDFEEGYLEYAEICVQEGQYNRALNSYLDVLGFVEEDCDLLTNIGNCYYLLGQYQEAQTYLNQALKLEGFNDHIHYLVAKNCLADLRPEKAIDSLKMAIEIDDEVEEYYYFLAKAYRMKGSVSNSLKFYKKATSVCPEQSFFWKKYVAYLIELKMYSEALIVIDKASCDTYDVELDYYSATINFLMNDKKKGIAQLEEALKEDFDKHKLIFEIVDDLKDDKEVTSLITYYYRELNPIFK